MVNCSNSPRAAAHTVVTGLPVCIFAKPPIPGRVKTRLASFLGQIAAADLASAMLCDVWSVVQRVAGVIPILAAAESGSFHIDVPAERIWLQQSGDLGSRIEYILRRGLRIGAAAIALGADSPLLSPAHLEEAIDCLKENDAVLGPAVDGGFYLLGVHDCPPGLLAGIRWSSEETCCETERSLQMHGMRAGKIRSLLDTDTLRELEALQNQLEYLPPEIAPHTRRWFDRTSWSASSFQR